MDYPVKYKNERDVEIPELLKFIDAHSDIKSSLDVGCADAKYSKDVWERIKDNYGVDMRRDPDVLPYLKVFARGDFVTLDPPRCDLVFSISAIEHYWVGVDKEDNPFAKQRLMAVKMAQLAKKYVFITFPYGVAADTGTNFVIYSKDTLPWFLEKLKDFKLSMRFYYSDNLQAGSPYEDVGEAVANTVLYDPKLGVRCVCIISGIRNEIQ